MLLQLVQTTHRFFKFLRLCPLEPILNLRVLLTGVKPLSGNRVSVLEGLGPILLVTGWFSSLLSQLAFNSLYPWIVGRIEPPVVEAGHFVAVRDRVLQVLLT